MEAKKEKLRKIFPFLVIGLIGFLIAFSIFSGGRFSFTSFSPLGKENDLINDGTETAVCNEVERQMTEKFGEDVRCECVLSKDKEDAYAEKAVGKEKAETLKEKADLYMVTCDFGGAKRKFSIWLTTNETQSMS